ncbi:MAG: peptidylprolyl isomerase [Clostridiales bacterium]|nr:peptidylprolyl isomerase [Clostridiales bacterium]
MTKKRIKISIIILLICAALSQLSACGTKSKDGVNVVLTTGFEKDEIFRIGSVSCTQPEIMVYLTNIQNQYERIYGAEIWNANLGDITLEENVKDIALAQIAQIKTMKLMAQQYEVELSEEEEQQAGNAAEVYFNSLNETEIEAMGVDKDTIEGLYKEYALADKVYKYIIKDINPEISDDEARTITVQHILFKTYATDGTGKKIEYTQKSKEETYMLACEVWERATEGEDFDELVVKYNEDSKSTYSFGKGEMDSALEEAAFNLGNGEISEVVETEAGYQIIKCISAFDKEETDSNKVKIVEQRRAEVFGQEYSAFVNDLTKKLNEELWENVHFIHDENVTTLSFFDVYNMYFSE